MDASSFVLRTGGGQKVSSSRIVLLCWLSHTGSAVQTTHTPGASAGRQFSPPADCSSQWLIKSHLLCHWQGDRGYFPLNLWQMVAKEPFRNWEIFSILKESGSDTLSRGRVGDLTLSPFFISTEHTTNSQLSEQPGCVCFIRHCFHCTCWLNRLNNLCIWAVNILEMNALSHLSLYSEIKLWLNIETIGFPLCWRHC